MNDGSLTCCAIVQPFVHWSPAILHADISSIYFKVEVLRLPYHVCAFSGSFSYLIGLLARPSEKSWLELLPALSQSCGDKPPFVPCSGRQLKAKAENKTSRNIILDIV